MGILSIRYATTPWSLYLPLLFWPLHSREFSILGVTQLLRVLSGMLHFTLHSIATKYTITTCTLSTLIFQLRIYLTLSDMLQYTTVSLQLVYQMILSSTPATSTLARLLPSHQEEMRKMQCFIQVPLSNPMIMCLSYTPYFFTISFNDWQNLQWQLGLVWLWYQKHVCSAKPQSREFLHTVRYTSCNCRTQLLLCPCTCGGVRNIL
jgi:hypothetical protein